MRKIILILKKNMVNLSRFILIFLFLSCSLIGNSQNSLNYEYITKAFIKTEEKKLKARKFPHLELNTFDGSNESLTKIISSSKHTLLFFCVLSNNAGAEATLNYYNKEFGEFEKTENLKRILVIVYDNKAKNEIELIRKIRTKWNNIDYIFQDDLIAKPGNKNQNYEAKSSNELIEVYKDYEGGGITGQSFFIIDSTLKICYDGDWSLISTYLKRFNHQKVYDTITLSNKNIVSLAGKSTSLSSILKQNELSLLLFSSTSFEKIDGPYGEAFTGGLGKFSYENIFSIAELKNILVKHKIQVYAFHRGFYSSTAFNTIKSSYLKLYTKLQVNIDSIMENVYIDNMGDITELPKYLDSSLHKNRRYEPSIFISFLKSNNSFVFSQNKNEREKMITLLGGNLILLVNNKGQIIFYKMGADITASTELVNLMLSAYQFKEALNE